MRWARLMGVALLVAACRLPTGYRRPAERNLNAIGAPAVGVGTNGFEIGRSELPAAPRVGGEARAERRTESGRLLSLANGEAIIEKPLGGSVRLNVDPSAAVTLNGRPAHPDSVPAGAEVRASCSVAGPDLVAHSIEARVRHP